MSNASSSNISAIALHTSTSIYDNFSEFFFPISDNRTTYFSKSKYSLYWCVIRFDDWAKCWWCLYKAVDNIPGNVNLARHVNFQEMIYKWKSHNEGKVEKEIWINQSQTHQTQKRMWWGKFPSRGGPGQKRRGVARGEGKVVGQSVPLPTSESHG